MLKILKVFIFFITLVLNNNVNAKPVPPGAGEGDVPANILFLVDSSASTVSYTHLTLPTNREV